MRPGQAKGPSVKNSGPTGPPGPAGPPGVSGLWAKYTFTHTQFRAASLTNDIQLLSLPAGNLVLGVLLYPTIQFSGTGITSYKLSCGIAGDLAQLLPPFSVDQAVGGTYFSLANVLMGYNLSAATSLRISAVAEGANLDQSTAGAVSVYVSLAGLAP